MMKNYLKEIENIEEVIKELENELKDFNKSLHELDFLVKLYTLDLSEDLRINGQFTRNEITNEWLGLANKRDEYKQDMEELEARIHNLKRKKDKLKKEYKAIHTRDFYKPIDDIDILNIIGKDGFIIGIKF